MTILNRNEFISKFNEIMRDHGPSCSNDDHPLWEAEKSYPTRVMCSHFICVPPILTTNTKKSDYWYWVTQSMSGQLVCYSSDDREREEWWGFTNEKDIPLWILKWASIPLTAGT